MRDLRAFVDGKTMGNPPRLEDRMDERGRQKSKAMKVKIPQTTSKQSRPKIAPDMRPSSRGKQLNGHDVFDTDLDGLEDTTASYVQVEDNQVDGDGQPIADQMQYQPSRGFGLVDSENGMDESYRDIDLDQTQDHTLTNDQFSEFLRPHDDKNPQSVDASFFGDAGSYPATTSGRPDDEEAADEAEPALQHHSHDPPLTLSQFKAAYERRKLGRSPMPQHHFTRAQPSGHTYHRGSVLPKNGESALPNVGHSQKQSRLPLREPSPGRAIPPSHSLQDAQSHGINVRPTLGGLQPSRTGFLSIQPNRSSGPKPTYPSTTQAQQPLSKNNNPRDLLKALAQEDQHTKEHHAQEQLEMNLDYLEDELDGMPYSKLQQEPLDHDPNAPDSVLPSSMDNKPLADRLLAAQKLDPEKQRVFFAALRFDDWEEAGDWFVGQFSSLIGKFRDARKEKRGAARDFEDEMHGRHHVVEKRKHVIEDAMVNMKVEGQGLLRGSTPGPKRRRA